MSKKYDDNIDEFLVKVISHDFSKCTSFFWQFTKLSTKHLLEPQNRSKNLNVATYNSYSFFIHYLYEFLIGCYKRDIRDTSSLCCKTKDTAINEQVNKILKKWILLIDKRIAPDFANERSYYDEKCPKDFSSSFRTVRNNAVHTDYRRLDSKTRISLSEFYKKYHKYVMLLFNDAKSWWQVEDYEKVEFGEITEFNNMIHSDL